MKILFVFTGGTIGSTLSNDCIGLDQNKPFLILEAYRKYYGIGFDHDTINPVNLLSENSTGKSISVIVNTVIEKSAAGYDGIIVLHGTDTIQYTAAALGYCMGNDCTPVCLVSSNYPIEDPRANGMINLHAAISFIREYGYKGVWVTYRNHGERMTHLHRATRLIAHQTGGADLYSIHDSYYGTLNDIGALTPNDSYTEHSDEITPFGMIKLTHICKTIMRITPNPGMIYPAVPGDVKYIIHESFHSGTINTGSDTYRSFFDQMYARRIPVYLTGTVSGPGYESTDEYAGMHITCIPGISPIALYMKLWIADSAGMPAPDVITHSLGGDLP